MEQYNVMKVGWLMSIAPLETMRVLLENQRTEIYPAKIYAKSGLTYSHVIKVLKEFERLGFVKSVPSSEKRRKAVRLTEEGREVAEHLIAIYNGISGGKERLE